MPTHEELKAALAALEHGLTRYAIGSTALVYLKEDHPSDGFVRVYRAIRTLGNKVQVEENQFEQMRVKGTDFKVTHNRLTGEVRVHTRVGLLVLPQGSRLLVAGRY